MKRRFVLLALLISLCVSFPDQQARAISISPAIVDVSVDTGSTTDFSILVTNEENQTLSFALTIQKFLPQGTSGQTIFLPPEDTAGLPDWLFLEAPTVTLRPGESRRVPVSLRVPYEASPGGHYAAIFLTQTSLDTAAGQNVSAIPRIGVLVFATVKGDLIEKVALKDVRIEQADTSHLPVVVKTEVENRGNVHVEPKIEIEIKNIFGQVVERLDANERKARILPGSSRVFESSWAKAISLNDGNAFLESMQEEWRNFAIGWYEARVSVGLPSGEAGEMFVRFQIWPWRTILVVFGLLVIILTVLKFMRGLKR